MLCDAANLQILNGASQVYPFLRSRFRDARALIPHPGFGEYQAAFPSCAVYEDNGRTGGRIAPQSEDTDVVVFVTPNNPTGTTLPAAQILAFACRNPGKTILGRRIVPGFSGRRSVRCGSLVRLLEKAPAENLHVICSLSKTLGIPGLRLGYVYSRNAEFLRDLGRDVPIWNLNSMAEFLLEIALKHRRSIEESLQKTAQDRDAFRVTLAALSPVDTVWPSGGNFLLTRFHWNAEHGRAEAARLLAERSIYVKDVSGRFHDGRAWWRIAVRLPKENALLADALRGGSKNRA